MIGLRMQLPGLRSLSVKLLASQAFFNAVEPVRALGDITQLKRLRIEAPPQQVSSSWQQHGSP
jgi:hypothetical protein